MHRKTIRGHRHQPHRQHPSNPTGPFSTTQAALGPSLGGVLIAGLGWPAIFFVNIPLGILALFFAYRYLPPDAALTKTEQVRFDHVGTLLLATTLAAYALAMTAGRGNFGLLNGAHFSRPCSAPDSSRSPKQKSHRHLSG